MGLTGYSAQSAETILSGSFAPYPCAVQRLPNLLRFAVIGPTGKPLVIREIWYDGQGVDENELRLQIENAREKLKQLGALK